MQKKIDTVILIDDDEIANFLVEDIIKEMQIAREIIIFPNGQEALMYFLQHQEEWKKGQAPSNLIFLDINMPVMNGFEFLEEYKKQGLERENSIVIALLTTSLNKTDINKAKKYNIIDYINKPLTEEKIHSLLNTFNIQY